MLYTVFFFHLMDKHTWQGRTAPQAQGPARTVHVVSDNDKATVSCFPNDKHIFLLRRTIVIVD